MKDTMSGILTMLGTLMLSWVFYFLAITYIGTGAWVWLFSGQVACLLASITVGIITLKRGEY